MQLSMNNLLASKVKMMRKQKTKTEPKFQLTRLDCLLFEKYKIFSQTYNIVGVHDIKYFFFSHLQGTNWIKCYRYDGFEESYHELDDASYKICFEIKNTLEEDTHGVQSNFS